MVSRLFGSSEPFSILQREVNRVFDEVFRGAPRSSAGGAFAPDLDVQETEAGIEVVAELPGMAEHDLDLRIEGDQLTLAGEKRDERTRDQAGVHLSECRFGRFQRSFRLPFIPDPTQVEARFDKGVLHVTLPRPHPRDQGAGRIPIHGVRYPKASAGPDAMVHQTGLEGHPGPPPPSPSTPTTTAPEEGQHPSSGHPMAATGGSAQGSAPERRSDQAPGTSSRPRDKVEEAGRESFPASDPPANSGITGVVADTKPR